MENKEEKTKIESEYINCFKFYNIIFSENASAEKIGKAYKDLFDELFALIGGIIGTANDQGCGEEVKILILELIDHLKLNIINYL